MAGRILCASSTEVTVGTTAKTILQLKSASNDRIKVLGWGVYFKGTSATAKPVLCTLCRQDGDITGTTCYASTSTYYPVTPLYTGETSTTQARYEATVEPSNSYSMEKREVHPQSGYEKSFPFGQEPPIEPDGRIGVRGVVDSGESNATVVGWMVYEE